MLQSLNFLKLIYSENTRFCSFLLFFLTKAIAWHVAL